MGKEPKPPSLDKIAEGIEANAPPAREDIPTAATPASSGSPAGSAPSPGAGPAPSGGGLTDRAIGALDRLGRSFDPKTHQTAADGSPILTKKGQLAIRGGRTSTGGAGPIAPALPGVEQQRQADLARFRSTAQVTVQSFASLASMFGGEIWEPSDAERVQLTDAWAEYYRVRGIRDVPPEIMLAAVMGGWALGTPDRRAQLASATTRLKGRFVRARSHRRSNGGGEIDPGPASDRVVPEPAFFGAGPAPR